MRTLTFAASALLTVSGAEPRRTNERFTAGAGAEHVEFAAEDEFPAEFAETELSDFVSAREEDKSSYSTGSESVVRSDKNALSGLNVERDGERETEKRELGPDADEVTFAPDSTGERSSSVNELLKTVMASSRCAGRFRVSKPQQRRAQARLQSIVRALSTPNSSLGGEGVGMANSTAYSYDSGPPMMHESCSKI